MCLAGGVRADGLEYRYELGGMAGVSSYYGDANYHIPLKNINAMGGIVWRYNINKPFDDANFIESLQVRNVIANHSFFTSNLTNL